jgi:hypothetical protein
VSARYLDEQRGREPISEVWTDAGWKHRQAFLVTPRGWVPHGTQLIYVANQRDGSRALAIDGLNDDNDGA